jgi:hypothetical protein
MREERLPKLPGWLCRRTFEEGRRRSSTPLCKRSGGPKRSGGNSRFGAFISRLDRLNSRFVLLREFEHNNFDLPHLCTGELPLKTTESGKIPVAREKPGISAAVEMLVEVDNFGALLKARGVSPNRGIAEPRGKSRLRGNA